MLFNSHELVCIGVLVVTSLNRHPLSIGQRPRENNFTAYLSLYFVASLSRHFPVNYTTAVVHFFSTTPASIIVVVVRRRSTKESQNAYKVRSISKSATTDRLYLSRRTYL